MKLRNQYCTREQAIRLKQLGVDNLLMGWTEPDEGEVDGIEDIEIPETGTFYSYMDCYNKESYWMINDCCVSVSDRHANPIKHYSVAELIVMNDGNGGIEFSTSGATKGKPYMQTDGFGDNKKSVFTYYETFAQAAAAKLIHALEEKWVTPFEVNERLAYS